MKFPGKPHKVQRSSLLFPIFCDSTFINDESSFRHIECSLKKILTNHFCWGWGVFFFLTQRKKNVWEQDQRSTTYWNKSLLLCCLQWMYGKCELTTVFHFILFHKQHFKSFLILPSKETPEPCAGNWLMTWAVGLNKMSPSCPVTSWWASTVLAQYCTMKPIVFLQKCFFHSWKISPKKTSNWWRGETQAQTCGPPSPWRMGQLDIYLSK